MQDRQLGDYNAQATHAVQNKQVEVVVAVVCAYQEKRYRHKHQELFRGRVLVAIIDLLPHGKIIVGAQVELKGRSFDLMEHDIRSDIVSQIRECPTPVIVEHQNKVEEHLQYNNQNNVDDPRAFEMDPVGIHVGVE